MGNDQSRETPIPEKTGDARADSATEHKSVLESQSHINPQDNKILTQSPDQVRALNTSCESTGLIPGMKFSESSAQQTEPPFVWGYSKKEADARAKEVLAKDNWSTDDTEFLHDWQKKIQEEQDKQLFSGEAAGQKLKGGVTQVDHHDRVKLQGGVQENRQDYGQEQKFALGGEQDQIAWRQWQERLNHGINDKLQGLLHGAGIPGGLECKISYDLTKNGGFNWRMTESSGNAQYDHIVAKAIDDTLRYHPELLKFPAGTQRTHYDREATFSTGAGRGAVRTGEVPDEIVKHY